MFRTVGGAKSEGNEYASAGLTKTGGAELPTTRTPLFSICQYLSRRRCLLKEGRRSA